jgi:Glutamine synthetase, catalytic domain
LYPNVLPGVLVPNIPEADVAAVCERLRTDGVDVVRVSYPDMIGVDRGRDVLLDELSAAVGHGLAFCRGVYHTSPGARMEVRLGDATANPYLAMAAVGAAVYLGLKDKVEPPAKLEGYGYDPGRADLLPALLADALDALEADQELCGVLGDYFVTSFLSYKRNEIERFERFVTDWEFREYAYHL